MKNTYLIVVWINFEIWSMKELKMVYFNEQGDINNEL